MTINKNNTKFDIDKYYLLEELKKAVIAKKNGDIPVGAVIVYNGNASEEFNYQFLIFALIVSIIAILLLVGAITYLLSDKKDNKDAEKYIDNEK